MSLLWLVAMVAVGIAAVVFAVHVTGGSAQARLDGEESAKRRFADDYPDLGTGAVRMTQDSAAAFLEVGAGRVGIVQAVGGKFLTRLVTRDDLAGPPAVDGREVSIHFKDFTWPGATFVFAAADDAAAVAAMLGFEPPAERRKTGIREKT